MAGMVNLGSEVRTKGKALNLHRLCRLPSSKFLGNVSTFDWAVIPACQRKVFPGGVPPN